MRKQKTVDVTSDTGLVVATQLPRKAMSIVKQNLSTDQLKVLRKREEDSGQISAVIAGLEKQKEKLQRKVNNNPDVRKLKETKSRLRDMQKLQKQNGTELEVLYENGLANVEGESLSNKLTTLGLNEAN